MTDGRSKQGGAFSTDAAAREFRRSLLAVLFAGIFAVAGMAGFAGWLMIRSQSFNRWIDHTYVVQSHVAALEAQVERAESAKRGYLLSPDPARLKSYQAFAAQVPTQLNLIAVDTFDNPTQRRLVVRLRTLTDAWTETGESTALRSSAPTAPATMERLRAPPDQQQLDQIRASAQAMLEEENRLLKLRIQREVDNSSTLFLVIVTGGGLVALLSVVAMVLMRRYASDLSRAQGALRLLNSELEDRVMVRTAELSRANEEIQRFAYIVSHDLRSPLVNVMGFTTELETSLKAVKTLIDDIEQEAPTRVPKAVFEAIDLDMPEAIGFIRTSTQKMDGLIKAILRLSREGRRTLTPEPLAMNAVVESLLANIRHRLLDQGAQASIESELPDLVSDRLAVEQVFGNLIDNAVKYLAPGRAGSIVVRGWREAGLVMYEIEDNGRGVAPQDHERIFELFRRSGPQDTTGEGIGLAHVRALMYRLGGVIRCTSALDRGAVFHLSFPPRLSLTSS